MGASKKQYEQMTTAEILDEKFGVIDYSFLKRIAEDAQWQEYEEQNINN